MWQRMLVWLFPFLCKHEREKRLYAAYLESEGVVHVHHCPTCDRIDVRTVVTAADLHG